MKKITGSYILEKYDKYSSKVGMLIVENYIVGVKDANLWESEHPKNSCVISRILYNTHDNNDKWEYKK